MTMHEDALLRASSRGGWDRRTLLKTFGAGAVAMAGIPLLAACTGGSAPASSGAEHGHASVPGPRTRSPRPPTRR